MAQIKNAEGFPIAGWLVNWSTNKLSIKVEHLTKLLVEVGINSEYARDVLPKNAVIRAIKNHMKTIESQDRKNIRFKESDESETMVMSLITVRINTTTNDRFEQLTKVTYHKGLGTFDIEGLYEKELRAGYEETKGAYAADQFRAVILRYVKRQCAAITYLETGSLYFIPASKKEELDKLIALFEKVGDNAQLHVKEEISTKSIRNTMWKLTVGEITQDLEKLEEDFKEMPDTLHARNVELKLKRYNTLKTKVEMFESVLQGTAEDLKSSLENLSNLVRKKVMD